MSEKDGSRGRGRQSIDAVATWARIGVTFAQVVVEAIILVHG
jgi:hypothetical protein